MQKIVAKYVCDRFRERDRRVKYNLVEQLYKFYKMYTTAIIALNLCYRCKHMCLYMRSVDNKALILSYPILFP